MRKSLVLLISLAAVLPGLLSAQEKDFGVGAILGEPTGVSLKKWLGARTAIDGALAWSFAALITNRNRRTDALCEAACTNNTANIRRDHHQI